MLCLVSLTTALLSISCVLVSGVNRCYPLKQARWQPMGYIVQRANCDTSVFSQRVAMSREILTIFSEIMQSSKDSVTEPTQWGQFVDTRSSRLASLHCEHRRTQLPYWHLNSSCPKPLASVFTSRQRGFREYQTRTRNRVTADSGPGLARSFTRIDTHKRFRCWLGQFLDCRSS